MSARPVKGGEDGEPLEATVTDERVVIVSRARARTAKTSVAVVKVHLDEANQLILSRRFNQALEHLVEVLAAYPENRKALDLAKVLIGLATGAGALPSVSAELIGEPLLDAVFDQCHRCHRFWAGAPRDEGLGDLVASGRAGGRCPECRKVWCRDCAERALKLRCRDCALPLETAATSSGRKRGLRPARRPELKIRRVFLFKAPPEPRNSGSYILRILDELCPEALHSKTRITLRVGEPGTNRDLAYACVYADAKARDFDTELTFFEPFEDGFGGRGILVTLYERP